VKNNGALSPAAVYDVLMHVPTGKVTTYGDIANVLGQPGASRAIGRILNKNPNPIKVPCHRVVMSDGTIGGYAFGKTRKRELLENEGIYFDGDNVLDFKKCRVDSGSLV
jgi:methylated-DNA-[protein]-cysteine S-methyltransferase